MLPVRCAVRPMALVNHPGQLCERLGPGEDNRTGMPSARGPRGYREAGITEQQDGGDGRS